MSRRLFAISTLAFAIAAASCTDGPATNGNLRPGSNARPVDVDVLDFENPAIQNRFACFNAAARNFTGKSSIIGRFNMAILT